MKAARQISIAILLLMALVAIFISCRVITDPTGSSMGFPSYLLSGTIFNNYATAGWIMLFTIGLFSLLVIVFIIRKSRIYSILIMVQGVIVCVAIFLQILLIEESFLIQYLFLAIGVILIALGALQNQRKIATENERRANPQPLKSHHHKHRKNK
ncbi:MAG: hypothetical protein V4450_12150 [Bacteroidota bacterium]